MARLKSPKQKGDAYERELAHFMNAILFAGRDQVFRAPLSGGGRSFGHGLGQTGGSADLTGTPDIWVEAKRTEKFAPYPAMEQAERGIAGHKSDLPGFPFPTIINRRNNMKTEDSLVAMRLSDWLVLYRAYLEAAGYRTFRAEPIAPPPP